MVYKFQTDVTAHDLRICAIVIATSGKVRQLNDEPLQFTEEGVRKVIREIEPAAEAFTEFRQAIYVLSVFIGDIRTTMVNMAEESINFVVFTLLDMARKAEGGSSYLFDR